MRIIQDHIDQKIWRRHESHFPGGRLLAIIFKFAVIGIGVTYNIISMKCIYCFQAAYCRAYSLGAAGKTGKKVRLDKTDDDFFGCLEIMFIQINRDTARRNPYILQIILIRSIMTDNTAITH